jgi:hypothetical protein
MKLAISSLRCLFRAGCSSLVLASGLLPTADASAVQENSPPIHLYRDAGGATHTLDALAGNDGRISRLVPRAVSQDEISRIQGAGLEVVFIEPDDDAPVGPSGVRPIAQVPPRFSLVSIDGTVYGTFFVEGDRPDGASTHWVSFTFSSFNLENFDSHSAIGLLVDTRQLTEDFPPTFAPAAVGNGIIFGNVSGTPGGCGEGSNIDPIHNMQVESYWNGGNRIYPSTCYPWGILYQRFDVEVLADTRGVVRYRRSRDSAGAEDMWNSPRVDTLPDRPAGTAGTLEGGGIFFAMVRDPDPDGWTAVMSFDNARSGWY